VLRRVDAAVARPPARVSPHERQLLFAAADRAVDTSGMSGGPVFALPADGEPVFVGILLGRVEETFLVFGRELLVIQPWPRDPGTPAPSGPRPPAP
jgi:hypothetical protein